MSGGSIVWILDADSGKFSQALIQAEDQANKTAGVIDRSLGKASASASSSIGNLAGSLARVGWSAFNIGVVGATTALGGLIKTGLSSGLNLQSIQIQMNGLTKSIDLGRKAMAGAYEYAQKSPFKLPEVAGTTKTLLAFGMSVDDAVKSLDLLGGISITSGVPLEAIGGIFGRVSAQGRLMGGDIQQLTENGIAVLPALQKALGKTADEVRAMASDGQIDFKTFRKAMESIVDPSILAQLENTLPRQLDRLRGSIRVLAGSLVGYTVDVNKGFNLMEDSIIQAATDMVKNLATTLRAKPVLEAANRFGQTLSPYIDKITAFFKVPDGKEFSAAADLIADFFNMVADLGPLIIPILGGLAISSTSFLSNIPLLGDAISPIGKGFNDLALGALSLLNPLNAFKSSVPEAGGHLLTFKGGLDGVTGGFTRAKDGTTNFLSSLGNLGSVLQGGWANILTFGGALRETGDNALSAGNTKFPRLGSAVEGMASKFGGAKDSVLDFGSKMNPIPGIMDRVGGATEAVKGKFGFLGDAFDNVKGKASGFGSVISPITNLLPGMDSVLGGASKGLGLFGQATAGAGGALTSIIGIFGKGALAIGGMGAVFGIAAAGLGLLAESMGMNAEQMTGYINNMVNGIVTGFSKFLAELPAMINALTENIATYIPILVDALMTLVDGVINALATSGPAIVQGVMNLITVLADTFLTQLPRIVEAGIALITFLVDGIISALPTLISTLVSVGTQLISTLGQTIPKIVQAGADIILALVTGLLENLPAIIDGITQLISTLTKTIADMLPKLIETGIKLVEGIADGLVQNLPAIITAITGLITQIITSLVTLLPKLLEAGLKIVLGIISGISEALPTIIPAIVTMITTIITALVEALPMLLEAGIKILMALIQGIVDNLPAIIEAINILITTLLQAIVDNLPMIIQGAVTLITVLAESMSENLPLIIDAIVKIIIAIVQVLLQNLPLLIQAAIEIVIALVVGLVKAIPQLVKAVLSLGAAILKSLWEGVKGIADVGMNIVKGIWEGIQSMGSWIKQKVVDFVKDKIPGPIRKALGIASPSKVFMGIGHFMMEGLVKGITREGSGLVKASQSIAEQVTGAFSSLDGSNAISYSASLEDNIPRNISSLNRAVGIDYGITGQGATGTGATINQTNNVYTEIDMEQINRDLAWELSKA